MKASLLGIDLTAKKATIVDSGNESFSTTNLALIGQAVTSILKKPDETANKYLSQYFPQSMFLATLSTAWKTPSLPCLSHRLQAHRINLECSDFILHYNAERDSQGCGGTN